MSGAKATAASSGRYTVIEITPALFNEAPRLANSHALRGYDAVQLAAALEINQIEEIDHGNRGIERNGR